MRTLTDLVLRAEADPAGDERLLLWTPSARLSYRQAGNAIRRLATELDRHGIRRGDHVLVAMPNGPEFVITLFGVLHAGCVAVLGDVNVDVPRLPAAGRWIATYSPAEPGDDSPGALVPVGFRNVRSGHSWFFDGASALAELEPPPEATASCKPSADDVAMVLYTSGSDGQPRGVLKTHANLIVELDYLADILSEGVDRVLSVLPWSYIYGLIHHLLLPARLRATACHLARYTPRSLLETIESQQVDVFVGVPSLYRTLARLPDPPVNAGLRWFVSSGAPLDHATVRLLEKRHHRIVELYGSTETGAIAVNLDKAQSPDSAGRVVPYLEIRVGPGERMVASDSGKEGTLWARGPTVSRFAYDENRLYQITESDDWYSTGDLARLTSANELRLVGRTTRIIKVDGYRVSLDEVEAALLRLPGIVDVLATAQRDPIHGEVAGVEIATDRESTWTEDSLREACRELLPAQKRPRSIRFFDSLERKPRGKSSPGGGPERAPGEPA